MDASEHSSRESDANSNLSKGERRNSARRGSLSKLGSFVLGLGGGTSASSGSFKAGSNGSFKAGSKEADSVNSLTEGYRNRATANDTNEQKSSEDSRSSDLKEKVNHVPITSVAQAYRGGIFLDSKLDHMKANFFEELFLEQATVILYIFYVFWFSLLVDYMLAYK